MTLPRPDHPTASLASAIAPSLAAVLAMASLGAFQADPVGAAETAYLALAAGVVLVAAGSLTGGGAGRSRGPAVEAMAGPLLVTVAVWTLPAGPARGAVALVLAAGTLGVAALRWYSEAEGQPTGRAEGGAAHLSAVPVLALAVGLQTLLRGKELLLASEGGADWQGALRGAVLFVAFPAAGTAAVLVLDRLHGRRRALLAAAAVLLVGPGFRPATLAALVALAAAPALLIRRGGRDPLSTRGLRLGALALLAAPFAWDPRAAGAAVVAGLAGGLLPAAEPEDRSAGLRLHPVRSWIPAALAGVALALALLLPGRSAGETVALAALVPLAVPALGLPGRDRAPVALAALLLAFAAARGVLVEGALAAPAVLAALAVPRRGPVAAVQGAWVGALLAAASLLGAYPWLRSDPLRGALDLIGVPPGWPGALTVVAAVAGVAGLGILVGRTRWSAGHEGAAGRAAAVVLAGLVLLRVPAVGATPLGARTLVLDDDRPSWTTPVPADPARVRTVVLESTLAHAAALPAGTPVATLRLREPDGPDRVWTLRTGSDTGEWAAERPDLRGSHPAAPRPWISRVAAEGAFFSRRYRASHRFPEPVAPEHLELSLRPDLPPEVLLTVYHLELRP